MKKVKHFLAVIGSVAVSVIGCFLFAQGFNNLFSSNFLANMFGGACMMLGGYDFFAGLTLLAEVIAGKKLILNFFVVNDGSDEKKETGNER